MKVADTGHGISPELLPRIFEPWVSTKPPGSGIGLGLPIARDIIAAHGGSISVATEVSRGTTFTIELPADTGRDRPSSR
jgi:signal transduction histidine kinase